MPDDLRVKAFDRDGTFVTRDQCSDAFGEPPVPVKVALDFDDQRRPPGNRIDERAQDRYVVACVLHHQRGEVRDIMFCKVAASASKSLQRRVVEDYGFTIARQLHVAFDRKAVLDRSLCRRKGILDDPVLARMQAAMGDRSRGQPGRCTHAPISNIPSTSTAASSGNWATPMVERAWRPRSPKTLMIRSDAPF